MKITNPNQKPKSENQIQKFKNLKTRYYKSENLNIPKIKDKNIKIRTPNNQ